MAVFKIKRTRAKNSIIICSFQVFGTETRFWLIIDFLFYNLRNAVPRTVGFLCVSILCCPVRICFLKVHTLPPAFPDRDCWPELIIAINIHRQGAYKTHTGRYANLIFSDKRNSQKNKIRKRTQKRKPAVPCRESLQTKTVTFQAIDNQHVYMWQKICLRYFKISQTYFRLSPLYFKFPAGSFLRVRKKYFFKR